MIPRSESYALAIDGVVTFKGSKRDCASRRKAFVRQHGLGRAFTWLAPHKQIGEPLA